ncbi:uncharacterized protein [Oryza sativa Japonica Group]|nr:uncharacterized protein LOC9266793 [Oryza sativa Japonica Group]KAF2922943.1 hypothetical protein DAI22_07g152100 [Oryza sativa Japonica Group]BAD31050.1 hypothetical protein [Oryza sativa Japonica Group]
MARNTVFRFQVTNAGEEEEPEERQIAVDPFSLRQFSRLDIDGPLPIPSVSVDHHHHHAPHARPGPALVLAGASASVPTSPRRVSAWDAPPTRWDAHLAVVAAAPAARVASSDVMAPPRTAISRSRSCAGAAEAELDDDEFDVILSSSERKASAPQRWGSDVPLIGAGDGAEDSTGYAAADARGKSGRRKWKRGGGAAPFTCCLYLPGLGTRRTAKPSPPTAAARASSLPSSPATFRGGGGGGGVESDPGTARASTMSLAMSLERFDCGSCSTSSRSGLALDGEAGSSYFDLPLELILGCDGDDEADLPVHAAFMFDSDGIRKSVLKKGVRRAAAAAARPSVGKMSTDGPDRISGRHVRFYVTSGSSPTSTPAVVSVLAGER